jgi:lactose/L-arabinose transport system permease protein
LSGRPERLQAVVLHLLLAPLALLWIAPLWLMVVFATLPDSAIFSDRLRLLPGDQLGANLGGLLTGLDFGRALLNSVGIAAIYALLSVLLTSMAGYAFARFRFVGKGALFALVMATLTVPFFVVVVPQYILVARTLGMADTWAAVIVPPLFNSLGVLFMRQIFQSLPEELLEAARVDGAGEARIFFRIALPLVLPGMAALGIILFLASWNNYLWPLLVAADRTVVTAPVALGRLIGLTQVSWGGIMAGASLLTVPMVVVFLLLQRHFVAGITAGAVK